MLGETCFERGRSSRILAKVYRFELCDERQWVFTWARRYLRYDVGGILTASFLSAVVIITPCRCDEDGSCSNFRG